MNTKTNTGPGTATALSIGEVEARTGLTARALRLYETRGLIAPDRGAGGRREYGVADLSRIATIRLLKDAGFSLAEIGVLLERPDMIANIVPLRLAEIDESLSDLTQARQRLTVVAEALEDGEALSLDMALVLIEAGEGGAEAARWTRAWQATFGTPPPDDWGDLQRRVAGDDPTSVDRAWRDLAADITAAIPQGPDSQAAQVLLARWNALVADFRKHATAAQSAQASEFWSRAGEWGDRVDQPITGDIIGFIRAAAAHAAPKTATDAAPTKNDEARP